MGRLKAYKEQIADEEEQGKLMYADGASNQTNRTPKDQTNQSYQEQANRDYYGDTYRGGGRGGRSHYYRGRGRAQCPDCLLKLQEAQENDNTSTQEADELMMHEVVFLNEKNDLQENMWYLDNGASNHMTGDRRYFSSINNAITGKVRFGDDSRIDIKGKGTISCTDMNGESRKMTDVYSIPDLKSNIISLGQATEAGCYIRMKGEELTMHDQYGNLLVKAR
ncbi:uncharacterized protein LOC106414165 [Brassica napus]|uniref:uncharacterized protein LOC106414165 n=1 Tax=Brassica napus TaxID=3708 RepID=UPI0006AB5486|nr:uncharacterized protein LOC106414165 [Brassica napus]